MLRVFACAVLCLVANPIVGAQTVYRCGSTYSQDPCPGAVNVVAKADPRTPAEAAKAASWAERDMKQANAMEKARLAQEAKAPKAVILGPATAPQAAASKPAPVKLAKGRKPEQFVAMEPRKPGEGKKKKAKES